MKKEIKNHPLKDMIILTKRPDNMSYEKYKMLKKVIDKRIKKYLQYPVKHINFLNKGKYYPVYNADKIMNNRTQNKGRKGRNLQTIVLESGRIKHILHYV